MKITDIETFVVHGGRRPWLFSAVRTDAGITGYGEFGSGNAAHALMGLIEDLKPLVVGKDPEAVEKLYFDMYRYLRQAPGGLSQMGIAGIELACWDIKGKALGVPVNNLVGGPFRDNQRVYWSHLATYRASSAEIMGKPRLRTMEDVANCAREAVDEGYTAFKTNIVFPGENSSQISQGYSGTNDQNAPTDLVRHAAE